MLTDKSEVTVRGQFREKCQINEMIDATEFDCSTLYTSCRVAIVGSDERIWVERIVNYRSAVSRTDTAKLRSYRQLHRPHAGK